VEDAEAMRFEYDLATRTAVLDGVETLLAGSTTWGLGPQYLTTEQSVPLALVKATSVRFIDEVMVPHGHNFGRTWAHKKGDPRFLPEHGSTAYYSRWQSLLDTLFSENILPSVMLFRGDEQADGQLPGWQSDHINRMIQVVGDRPVIWDVCNECKPLGKEWQKRVVSILKDRDTHNNLISVSTGKNGMSFPAMVDSEATAIALLDAWQPAPKIAALRDSDHSGILHGTWPDKESYYVRGASESSLLVHMESFPGSNLHHSGSVYNENNPTFPKVRALLGELIRESQGDTPPPPPPPPPPPEDWFHILDFLIPKRELLGQRLAREDGKSGYTPYQTSNRLWGPKWETGFGWDAYVWDQETLYFLLTEGDRAPGEKADPTSWKGPIYPKPIAPLMCPVGRPGSVVTHDGWKAQNHKGCEPGEIHTVGQESYSVYAYQQAGWTKDPIGTPIGGIVPNSTPTIKIHHQWGVGHLEVFVYALGFGRVRWVHVHNGEVVNHITTNTLAEPPAPLLFPCKPEWIDPDWVMPIEKPPVVKPPPGNGGGGGGCSLVLAAGVLVAAVGWWVFG
jgi:hypothetical protein